jgi:hypothetical protein
MTPDAIEALPYIIGGTVLFATALATAYNDGEAADSIERADRRPVSRWSTVYMIVATAGASGLFLAAGAIGFKIGAGQ